MLFLLVSFWSFNAMAQIRITDDKVTPNANPTHFVTSDPKKQIVTLPVNITMIGEFVNESAQTDLTKVNLKLFSNPSSSPAPIISISTKTPLSINGLALVTSTNASSAANRTYRMTGDWTVSESINFDKGKLLVDKVSSAAGTLTYTGSNDLVGTDESYVNGRIFMKGSGVRTFPIGNTNGYFPARLDGVSAADATISLGLEVTTDPGFVKTPDLKDIFTSHFWEFSTGGTGVFSGNTQISLSDNTSEFFGTDGDATILELSNSGVQTDLFGSPNNSFYTSSSPMSASGKYYGLAKADQITVRIRKLITPNDDQENDVLVVDGLDAFPDNQITLIDRWGVVVKTWKGFVNYKEPAGVEQSDFNFAKLAIGNYVCVVEYTERGTRKSKKQMIAVLK
ncbi:MAG: hypothetical protein HOP37_10810 [Cyclobacteriaceae bacterium]|nr:hypothetical protein [Cyclobacteriaceae bacterium]